MNVKTGLIGLSAGLATLLGACVQQQSSEPATTAEAETAAPQAKKVTLPAPITTIKPGASVTFSLDKAKPIASGDNGSVTLTVNEGYPSGVLLLSATGDAGLTVFGAEKTARKDMSAGTSHPWRLDYSAEADGVYYINVLATIEMADGFSEMRAHAIRVEIGDWQSAQAKVKAATKMETLPGGERAVILDAQETTE